MKSVCRWLEEDAGITLGVTSLTSYISRIRRRERRNPEATARQSVRSQTEAISESLSAGTPRRPPIATDTLTNPPDDPLAQAMRVLLKPKMDIRKVHNDGDPQGRNLI